MPCADSPPGAADLVAPAARVRVEEEERPVLFREPQQRRDERDVLHHVGEVAGVEGVPVFHASPSQSRGRSQSRARASSGRTRLGRVAVLPARERRQRHQDRFGAPAGLQPEQRAAVVDQVEFDIAAAPQQLERSAPARRTASSRRRSAIGSQAFGKASPTRAREREAGVEGRLVEVVEEEPADAARLVAVRQEEIAVAPGLVPCVAAGRMPAQASRAVRCQCSTSSRTG